MYELYLISEDCLTHPEIDAGESGASGGFWSVFLDLVNEPDWEPESEAGLNLHSDFAERKTFSKGEFEWTQEKGKRYLNNTRRNLTDLIRRYKISGNGANQVTHDKSDNELDNGDENRGRFNAEQAIRVARRNGDHTSNGDNQFSYLRHLPVDFLFTWHLFDKLNLLHFTCAQLAHGHGTSSHQSPTCVSWVSS